MSVASATGKSKAVQSKRAEAVLPERTATYKGPITDTSHWDDFDLMAGDIVLSTPPKSGTTWSQAILMMLIHGRAVDDREVWLDSVWLDSAFRKNDDLIERLRSQAHRRCIKSHTPFDGIPYDPDVTYFAVYRHPLDVHFSMKRHVDNLIPDFLDFMYPGDTAENVERFLTAPATASGTDDLTLAALVHHFQTFAKWAHLPNVHLFHYADLKRDVAGQVARYAALTGFNVPDDLIRDIAEATSFKTMKQATIGAHKASGDAKSPFKDPSQFFDQGRNNRWSAEMTDAQVAQYNDRLDELLPDADARGWLEQGDA